MPSAVSSKDFKYYHPMLTSRQKLNWSQGNLNSFPQSSLLAYDLQSVSSPDSENSFYGEEAVFLLPISTFTELYCNSK